MSVRRRAGRIIGEGDHDGECIAELLEVIAHGDHVFLTRQSSEMPVQHQQQRCAVVVAETPRLPVVIDERDIGQQSPFVDLAVSVIRGPSREICRDSTRRPSAVGSWARGIGVDRRAIIDLRSSDPARELAPRAPQSFPSPALEPVDVCPDRHPFWLGVAGDTCRIVTRTGWGVVSPHACGNDEELGTANRRAARPCCGRRPGAHQGAGLRDLRERPPHVAVRTRDARADERDLGERSGRFAA